MAVVVAVSARYALGLWIAAGAAGGVRGDRWWCPAAGLVAAMVVPQNFYTPVFKQIVEWLEYALLVAMFPLAFWLMDVFAAIRYRS